MKRPHEGYASAAGSIQAVDGDASAGVLRRGPDGVFRDAATMPEGLPEPAPMPLAVGVPTWQATNPFNDLERHEGITRARKRMRNHCNHKRGESFNERGLCWGCGRTKNEIELAREERRKR